MALRLISKALIPNLEQDMAQIMKKEVDSVAPLLNSMLRPQCYGFASCSQGASTGAIHASGLRAASSSASTSSRVVKMDLPFKQRGLFE